MTHLRLIVRSLRHYARSQAGALLGAAVGSAVLIGALVVGDSVRGSLRRLALARLGPVHLALNSGDRLFREDLAAEIAALLPKFPQHPYSVVPGLALPGVAATGDGSGRANRIQVFGVDSRFWSLLTDAGAPVLPTAAGPADATFTAALLELVTRGGAADSVVLNEALARQLRVSAGAQVVLRVQKPSALSRDAPLSPEEDTSVALRLRVQAVVGEAHLGNFSLQASQLPPFNAFVPLALLQQRLDTPRRINLMLATEGPPPPPPTLGSGQMQPVYPPLEPSLTNALRQRWQLADAELEWRDAMPFGTVELRSRRVFLDPPAVEAAFAVYHDATSRQLVAQGRQAPVTPVGVLTYFVNELRVGERATPYSMVTAIAGAPVPAGLRDDEIAITQWLAEDLGARPGDDLALRYYVVGSSRALEERTNRFRVHSVLPMDTPGLDRSLMPDFPGMTDAANCRDWDTGLPIQTDRIRAKDEQYWTDYRGTPKAFVTLAAGQEMWRNRFGALTAVRYPLGPTLPSPAGPGSAQARLGLEQAKTGLTRALLARLDPASVGLHFEAVRERALAASAQGQDFGQLFLGFSFFLIVAALLLMALMFQFSIEQRAGEVGTLLALGFTPRAVRALLLGEGALLAALGAALGLAGGVRYAEALVRGLATVWRDAVGTTALAVQVEPMTLVLGGGASVAVTCLTMALALRRQARQPVRQLLAEGGEEGASDPAAPGARGRWARRVAFVGGAGALGLLGYALVSRAADAAGLFFGAGALVLGAGLAGCLAWWGALETRADPLRLEVRELGLRNLTRRRRRSLATVALLACGSFLIASIGAFRLETPRDAARRSSGTGGFALIAEATQPVIHDLNTAAGREKYGLDEAGLTNVSFVPLRVQDGEDASCLNLNRAQQPRVLGVQPERLAARHAFTFAQTARGFTAAQPWLLLRPLPGDDAVPAIGDVASIRYALGKRVGDTLDYTDERGRAFKLRLVAAVANSILQGNLIIAEDEFIRRFPSASGHRMFLIDAPAAAAQGVSAALTRGLRDLGLEVTPAAQRLAAFNAVQNTYLGTFQALGGLGLLLGSVGLGIVVLRNVFERRGELALLTAVGWDEPLRRRLVLSEHVTLLFLGLGLGVAAAAVAVLPTLATPGARVPYATLGLTLGLVVVNGILWTWVATRWALRGRLVDALHNE